MFGLLLRLPCPIVVSGCISFFGLDEGMMNAVVCLENPKFHLCDRVLVESVVSLRKFPVALPMLNCCVPHHHDAHRFIYGHTVICLISWKTIWPVCLSLFCMRSSVTKPYYLLLLDTSGIWYSPFHLLAHSNLSTSWNTFGLLAYFVLHMQHYFFCLAKSQRATSPLMRTASLICNSDLFSFHGKNDLVCVFSLFCMLSLLFHSHALLPCDTQYIKTHRFI